jgi:hypothetical protein
MNSNLERANQGELALTDWVRIAGLLIFGAFVCFAIVLFGIGANHPSANQTQSVVQTSTPTAGLESRPESAPEQRAQSVTAVTMPETRSESVPPSSEPLSPPIQQPLSGMTTEKPAIANTKGADAIRKHQRYSVMRRHASRRRSAVDKVVFKSVNTLVEMWRRIFKARK